MFWVVAVFMTALVAATLGWPALRRAAVLPARAQHDVEVYGAQLRELSDDVERGAVPRAEAESARTEIARRLLRASGEAEALGPSRNQGSSRLIAVPIVLVIVAALPLYFALGRPDQPDEPLALRLSVDPEAADLPTLVAKAEARLRSHPDDGRGWEALIPIYTRLGRGADAVTAARNAIRLLGATADRQVQLGDAEMRMAGGEITDAAARSFGAALVEDPQNGPARFFLATRLWQQRKETEATTAWQAIVEKGPADAPWVEASRKALDEPRRTTAMDGSGRRGPSSADVAAASDMADEDRSAMIRGMVSQLAARLESAPNDPEGWRRLMRSYAVLGKGAEARDAYARAQRVFAEGSPDRRSIDEFAATLGLGDRKATP